MLKRWIGLTYGYGGNMCVPIYTVETESLNGFKEEEFIRYYNFIQENKKLFDDYDSVEQVGLLYSMPAIWKLWKPWSRDDS